MTFRTYDKLNKEKHLIEHIAANLSHQNREEARLLFPGIPLRVLITTQVDNTERGFALFSAKGEPCGIGGVFADGTIWFVVTQDAPEKLCISWFKQTRKWLNDLHETHHRIEGYCWARNTLSQEWMKFMGFDFAPADSRANKEVAGEKFLYFMRTPVCASRQ